MPSEPPGIEAALGKIRLAAFDADGVLTDGRFLLHADGRDAMPFCTRDGLGLRLLMDEGIAVAVISGRRSATLARRMVALKVRRLRMGVADKGRVLAEMLASLSLTPAEALFMGDDLPDLVAMALAGVAAAPADAAPEVRARAAVVTASPGGHGAVREIAERILRARGRFEAAVARFTGCP